MGTGTRGRVRLLGVAGAALVAAAMLTSCSEALGAPGGAATGTPSATTVATPVAATPSPLATDGATPTATATPSAVPTAQPTVPVDQATPTPTPGPDGLAAVVPFVTEADVHGDALEVAAIVPGVAEAGGTCTVVAASGSTMRSASGAGVLAGSYTGCEAVELTGLTPGTWSVTVRYASHVAAGTSSPRSVQVG